MDELKEERKKKNDRCAKTHRHTHMHTQTITRQHACSTFGGGTLVQVSQYFIFDAGTNWLMLY